MEELGHSPLRLKTSLTRSHRTNYRLKFVHRSACTVSIWVALLASYRFCTPLVATCHNYFLGWKSSSNLLLGKSPLVKYSSEVQLDMVACDEIMSGDCECLRIPIFVCVPCWTTVKPAIKDTPKEDNPLNKGQT